MSPTDRYEAERYQVDILLLFSMYFPYFLFCKVPIIQKKNQEKGIMRLITLTSLYG